MREACRDAGLPEHVTMTACRHGGIAAARKRRAWVEKEQTAAKIQNDPTKRISE